MKKVFLIVGLFSLSVFAAPKIATAQSGCYAMTIECPDGSTHNIVYCSHQDYWDWSEILCGVAIS